MKLTSVIAMAATFTASSMISAYAENTAVNKYTPTVERVEALVKAINAANEAINKQAENVQHDHQIWANSASISSFSGWTKFKAFWPFLSNSMRMGINTIQFGTDLSKIQFDKASSDLDQYHSIMTDMMNGGAQPMTFTVTKSLLHTIQSTQKVDLSTAKIRYYEGMAQAYAIPKKIVGDANIAYQATLKLKDEYQSFTQKDCIDAVTASRATDLYKTILKSANSFNQLMEDNKLLNAIKFLSDSNNYIQFYFTAKAQDVCNYQQANQKLANNMFMNAYMNGFSQYKSLISKAGLNANNDHAYPVYAATAAIDFVTLTQIDEIINALKHLHG
ncbi:hypothetical protein L3V83_08205 [Thiotrichales bacterium 19X7-9]|nr:hypothetical protein [Thiotrichales bacterium 19X7-9]